MLGALQFLHTSLGYSNYLQSVVLAGLVPPMLPCFGQTRSSAPTLADNYCVGEHIGLH